MSGIPIGQLPVGAAMPLFNNILQSLRQTVAAAVSGAAPAPATSAGTAGSTAAGGSTAATVATSAGGANGATTNVQAFMHTLFQALKQDGLGAGTSGAAAATSASPNGAIAAPAGVPYQANLVSALQTLVGQVGSGAAANSATANLSAAYQNLVDPAGTGSAGTSAAPTAGLQNLLNNLLQNLQSGGVHSLSGVGSTVNASV
jgi:hypothetical protein